nr:MAG TPA: tail tape measure [Caudoviricetes sp.]
MIIDGFSYKISFKVDDTKLKKTEQSIKTLGNKFKAFAKSFAPIGAAFTTAGGLIANYIEKPLNNINELNKEKNRLFDITKAEIKQAKEYQANINKSRTFLKSLSTQIAIKLIPTVNQSIKGFNNFILKNKELIADGISKLLGWIIKTGQVFFNFFRGLNFVIKSTIGWKNALIVLIGVLAILKRAMITTFLTSPIGLIISAIMALMLLIDDLYTYLDGGDSLFGEYWEPFISAGKEVLAFFETMKPAILQLLSYVKGTFMGVVDFFKGLLQILVGVFTGNFDLIEKGWDNLIIGLKEYFINFKDWLIEFWSILAKVILNLLLVLKQGIIFVLDGLKKTVAWVFISLKDSVLSIWDKINSIVLNLLIGLKNSVVAIWDKISKAIMNLLENLKDNIIAVWNKTIEAILNLFDGFKNNLASAFTSIGELIKAPFENAFAWIKSQYEKYIEPIINAVKNLNPVNIVSNAKDSIKSLGSDAVSYGKNMLNKGLNLLGLGNDEPKKALIPAYATNNNQTTYNQGGTANTTINITTNNPQMAEQVVKNQRQLDLSYTQNNYGG